MIEVLNKDVIEKCISYLDLYDNLIFYTCCKTLNCSIDRKYIYRKISASKLIKYLSFNNNNPLTDSYDELKQYLHSANIPGFTEININNNNNTFECITFVSEYLIIKNNIHYIPNYNYSKNYNYYKVKKYTRSNSINSSQIIMTNVSIHKVYRHRPFGQVKMCIENSYLLKALLY